MLYLTKQKKKLLQEHIKAVTEMAPPYTACMSTMAMTIVLIDLPENHKLFHIKNATERQVLLLTMTDTWIAKQKERELTDVPPE